MKADEKIGAAKTSEQVRGVLASQLRAQSEKQLRRKLTPQTQTQNRNYNFSSNDYLGLSQHSEVIAAYQKGLLNWGAGAGASPLVTGYTAAHSELAEELAAWFGVDRVLLFNSGFSANQGVLQVLVKAGVVPIIDKLCHASIYDGVSCGGGFNQRIARFQHNNYNDLRDKLPRIAKTACPLVVSEGVFSMDGDTADIAELVRSKGSGLLMLDDAHGVGVTGKASRGVFDHSKARDIDIVTGTFGKAFGVAGAFVATDHQIADSLVQGARHLIYSTAFAPAQAEAIRAGLQLLQRDQTLQLALNQRIQLFKQCAAELKLRFADSSTAIQPLLVGDNALALRFSQALAEQGFQCIAIRPPTVPQGTARIRFTLSLHQSPSAIRALFSAIADILEADQELADACRI
ncbi:7-keto-8-aminopelargonate synthetase-like enzyme [Idiomarina sp. A28L]|uniref:aminotransferase class I/II-fold pyridoxal phosphate-dependent enzyme n=1 Tax=Idiomarina sp. A28L TaxID=1036674 RepID=UPI0002138A13|nr:8-amino-7-oxononanoate synthase [Idiomarina sp. A28L]EGN75842.1 7-keto-8-aminopelargonate synthetase-like enzyme [Idiomarina sp. A28L]